MSGAVQLEFAALTAEERRRARVALQARLLPQVLAISRGAAL